MPNNVLFKIHIVLAFISFIGAGIFSYLALMSAPLYINLGSALNNQGLKPFTTVSEMLHTNSTYTTFAFLFVLSTALNVWRFSKL